MLLGLVALMVSSAGSCFWARSPYGVVCWVVRRRTPGMAPRLVRLPMGSCNYSDLDVAVFGGTCRGFRDVFSTASSSIIPFVSPFIMCRRTPSTRIAPSLPAYGSL